LLRLIDGAHILPRGLRRARQALRPDVESRRLGLRRRLRPAVIVRLWFREAADPPQLGEQPDDVARRVASQKI